MKLFFFLLSMVSVQLIYGQEKLEKLSVEKIMRDPKWIGTSPLTPQWSTDGKFLFFKWNPEQAIADSFYYITPENNNPQKATPAITRNMVLFDNVIFNAARTAYVYSKDGDIFMVAVKDGLVKRITQTADFESNPSFSFNDTRIIFRRDLNVYAWEINTGLTEQLTNFKRGTIPPKEEKREGSNPQEKWLVRDQLQNFEVLRQRKEKADLTDSLNKKLRPKELRSIYTDDKMLREVSISADGRFVAYTLNKPGIGTKSTLVPAFVTESGFTTDISGRTKVGEAPDRSETFVFDTERDTVIALKTDALEGIRDLPDYANDYPEKDTSKQKKAALRIVDVKTINWSPSGHRAVLDIASNDNKDRWLMSLDPLTGKLETVDRQRDEAWIAGPGIGFRSHRGWINEHLFWYKSEASGYSHIYSFDLATKVKTPVTSGSYEVQETKLSNNKKFFYISTNETHPGEQQFYRVAVTGGRRERLTSLTGSNQAVVSPDEKFFAFLYSYTNKPWELYIQKNNPGSIAVQVTNKARSAEFNSYSWRDPAVMSFRASDGATVYARLYKPVNSDPNRPAVVFVHGAGYLQNAHKWWSTYFREYMFNNLLTDLGYTVMDVDYRGSAGYGRNWRTGIYRFMGGKDLQDQADAIKWMTDSLGIDKDRVGMYGGSYGGFITLMAMFTKPDLVKAGAALRSVTDWAHYNHGYTSAILNEPFTDSIAYKKSSPIYHASGLKNHLLICHGMLDVNVNFQDDVRLVQRLIELGKDNWELAVYPMEDHGFVEPSSWTDEYKRILKLFENVLKK